MFRKLLIFIFLKMSFFLEFLKLFSVSQMGYSWRTCLGS